MSGTDEKFEETMSRATYYIHTASAAGGLIGLVMGFGLGVIGGDTFTSGERAVEEADDVILVDALTREPAKTLLEKGHATPDQIRAAAEKGIRDLTDAANTAFSPVESAQETARQAVAAYLADKSTPPVVKIPAPTAP